MRGAGRLAAGLLVLVAACGGGGRAGGSTASPEPPRCETRFTVPAGFEPAGTFEEPAPDHVGVRLDFRDGGGRELHFSAGIAGEFGEGAPVASSLRLATGEEATLLGDGETWILVWDEAGACATHAVIGNSFTREAFVEVLRESVVVPAG
ncbi:MAG: hypothetical protein HYU54_04175 [Actinobacteria bacterium]|nr:hypothetical protein [Actinomycetota bacterium]